MINIGDVVTTCTKESYPYVIEVKEMRDNGKVSCLCTGVSGDMFETFNEEELRPYSAKELWEDIVRYYSLEEPYGKPFYSQSFLDFLESEAEEYESFRRECEKACKEEEMDVIDMDNSTLDEYDQALEIMGLLVTLKEVLEKEIKEVMQNNPASSIIVPISTGKLLATASADKEFPGIDIELIPKEETATASVPRVVFEEHKGNLHAYIWNNPDTEDCSMTVNFR